ncbi:MAG: Pls/PosA family non-ribosomal peptide synthetase [Pseudonocardia sp.]
MTQLHQFFEASCDRVPDAVAVEVGERLLTYGELDGRANRLAHVLRGRGVGPGSRVAILLERSEATYVALLGVLKSGAAFVPVDPAAPADRVGYIAADAGVDLVVTSAALAGKVHDAPVLDLDAVDRDLDTAPAHRPDPGPADAPAYVIYTSGSSGRPKGVEVAHASIVNFVEVVAREPGIYGVRGDDRVYQGMTISFDFSIEEIWPAWAVGATVVAGPNDERRLGADLADFLEGAAVTVLACVPTLLATLPRDLPGIRTLLVGGEACPGRLVVRWAKPGRLMLNTYGPTEATVTATYGELHPGEEVTIGRPLPTYTVALLDDDLRDVAAGEAGEICIGGPGVANGYVGLPEKTAERFVEHRGERIYRTGDLGQWTDDGRITYLGRADAEVKIRGHRVDLGEIDNVLLEDGGIASAVAALVEVGEGRSELAAYVVPHDRADEPADRLHEQLRRRLPDYMVPSYLDVVASLPTMPSGKVDRGALPAPTGRRLVATSGPVVAAEGELEEQVAAVWADAFGLEPGELSVEANFFDDLGGHSLLAATVVSMLRERGVGTSPAVRDLYGNPTVRGLAAHLDGGGEPEGAVPPLPRPEPLRHGRWRIAGAGLVQAAVYLLFVLAATTPITLVYDINDGRASAVISQFAGAALAGYLLVRWLLPPLLVPMLARGVTPGWHPLWGAVHLRLWTVDLLARTAPLPLLSGSPLMAPYLRRLGARIGERCHLGTSTITLPHLLRLDDDVTVGYNVTVRPWSVADGRVLVAPITLHTGAYVGSSGVLEPGATVGSVAAVAEHSVVAHGQFVPPGQWWGGSPTIPLIDADPVVDTLAGMEPPPDWTGRQLVAAKLGAAALELVSFATVAPSAVLVWYALLTYGAMAGLVAAALAGPVFVVTVCTLVAAVRRLVLPRTPPGVHEARSGFGLRKWMADKLLESSLTLTNSMYATLFTPVWLRTLGAKVGRGAELSTMAYFDPDLLALGRRSFVADIVSIGSATFYNGRVALLPTRIGERAFVGNAGFVPAGTTTAEDSLIGVHTVPPAAGVPAGTSWLGSPAIYLPQREESGAFSDRLTFAPSPWRVTERLAIESLRVAGPASLVSLAVFGYLYALSDLVQVTSLAAAVALAPLLALAASVAVVLVVVLLKWLVVGRYRPRVEPLWSRFVRRTELVTGFYEAAAVPALVGALAGTPMLPPALRLFGARIGARSWIGTTLLTEFDLARVGSDATVGPGVSLQTHLFEDRVMKMSTVTVGDGASVGERSIVLYDAVVGPGAALDPLSLLMKGEELPAGTRWRGIPAQGAAEQDWRGGRHRIDPEKTQEIAA